MGKQILTFDDIEIEKNNFYCHKSPIYLNDGDFEKTLVYSKLSSGEKSYKYFIGDVDNDDGDDYDKLFLWYG